MNELQPDDFEEILFVYESNLLEKEVEEYLWCKKIDVEAGIYQLHSIPFYGPAVATGDLIKAVSIQNSKQLFYENVVESSGNSVIQLVFDSNDELKTTCRKQLEKMQLKLEEATDNLMVIAVPKMSNYLHIYRVLLPYLNKEQLDIAEPLLSNKHKKDLRKGGFYVD